MSDVTPYENTLSIDELRREVRRGWDEIRLLTDAIRDSSDMPEPIILLLLSRAGKWPEDVEKGKEMQRQLGSEKIPFKTECEIGAGVWFRIRQGLVAAVPRS